MGEKSAVQWPAGRPVRQPGAGRGCPRAPPSSGAAARARSSRSWSSHRGTLRRGVPASSRLHAEEAGAGSPTPRPRYPVFVLPISLSHVYRMQTVNQCMNALLSISKTLWYDVKICEHISYLHGHAAWQQRPCLNRPSVNGCSAGAASRYTLRRERSAPPRPHPPRSRASSWPPTRSTWKVHPTTKVLALQPGPTVCLVADRKGCSIPRCMGNSSGAHHAVGRR